MNSNRFIAAFVSLTLTMVTTCCSADTGPIFETDIAQILVSKCGKCHATKVRKGGLDLSSFQGILNGGESEEPIIAKTLDESLLWTMIDGGDMPPRGQPQLTSSQRSIIKRWIMSGSRAARQSVPPKIVLSQHDVLPIVLLRCTTCHGPRLKRGGLDLRTPVSMLKGGSQGPAFVAGDPDGSRMIQRIESEACPPRGSLLKYFVKRPAASEVKVLRDWIKAGAPVGDVKPDVATTKPDLLVSDEDRQHWAFQQPKPGRQGKSIDDFVLAKLTAKGLTFSPEADRNTLIRRAYLDLIGLPPSLTELKKWRDFKTTNQAAPSNGGWYAAMIDHLLASPHYGERWGRYWLDLAGYADSEGGVSADPVRPVAWKYRDYVIRSFNNDKPYSRFLLEQIAGDELVDHANEPVITEAMVDNLIATGFLRMGIDQTGSRTMNFVPERLGVISDSITVLSTGVMGLTMGCARCHSHKYDAIPHRDYYRFKAIFQGTFDEHDWLTFKKRALNVDTPIQKNRYAKLNPKLRSELKTLESQLKQAYTTERLELLKQHYPLQSQVDRDETLRALRIADNNRTQPQRILVEKLQLVEVLDDSKQPPSVVAARELVFAINREIDLLRKRMQPPATIRAAWDRGEPSPTYILKRGEHTKPGRLVGPGVPSVLTDGRSPFVVSQPFPKGTRKTGRRLAFARWLTDGKHPLTARVMANRIWYHHFGTGLVKTLENFGKQGARPSNPELLDWLAVQFVEQGWSIKRMHQIIMNSQTYRQSSHVNEKRQQLDPQNRLLSRMPLRRMDAEALRDSLLFVSGQLDLTPSGIPDSVSISREGFVSANPTASGKWRRSIYMQYRRTEIPTMMDTFDYPEMGPNCMTRNVSTVSPQSLMLMNNQHVRNLAAQLAHRIEHLTTKASDKDFAQVRLVYQLTLSRLPSDRERQLGVEVLKELRAAWHDKPQQALSTYCHTVLNSAAFLYVD